MATERENSCGETDIYYCWFPNSSRWRSNLKSIYLRSCKSKQCLCNANSDRYPAVDYNLSFSDQKFSRVYDDAALFGVKFFGMDELITHSNIKHNDCKTLYHLFTFDVCKQKEKLKSSVVDIQIKANFTDNAPVNTRAFALVISDNTLSFQSDGNKMSVVY